MLNGIEITVHREPGRRRLLSGTLSVAAGLLILIWPNLLYYVVGGYLMALAVILFLFQVSTFLTALSLLASLMVFLFPELIPFTFAFFLGFFGLTFLLAFKLIPVGVLMLIFALLIIMEPGSVAGMIAVFLLLYGLIHIINLIQERRRGAG